MSHRVIRALLVAGTLFGVAAGVAFATGTIKLTEAVKYGCAKKNNGELRAVSDPGQCRKNERAVQFGSGSGTQGPTGPRGPAGPTGPRGPAGPTGPAGAGDTPAY